MQEQENALRIDRRQFIKIASFAGGGLFLLACGAPAAAPGSSSGPGTAAPAKPKLSATVDFANTGGGTGLGVLYIVAIDAFLKEEGITQKVTNYAGGGDLVRGITSGASQTGSPGMSSVIVAFSQGEPIRILAEYTNFATVLWYVKADSPIKSFKDARGKKIAYSSPGGNSQIQAIVALRTAGLNPEKDVELVRVGGIPETLTAVRGGIVDVGWGMDPLITQGVMKNEIRIVGTAGELLPKWCDGVIAVTADYAKSNPEVLTAYLRAFEKAINFIKSSPDKAAEMWAKAEGVDPEVTKLAMKNYPFQRQSSKIDPGDLTAVAQELLAAKQIKEIPAWDKLVDQSFLAPELRAKL